MPEYLAPGVYIEEVATGPRPIEGVSTSTTGFVGETERGPSRPRMVTSWQDYQRWYGGYIDRPPFTAAPFAVASDVLPYAVRGFFDNGGQRLFIARVTGPNAPTATINLPGAAGPTVVRAVGPGAWGNQILIAVRAASLAVPNTITARWFRILVLYYRQLPPGFPAGFVDPTDPTQLGNPARVPPDASEDFDNLTDDSTRPNYVRTQVNAASQLIEITASPGAPNIPVLFTAGRLQTGGPDPVPTATEYVGSDAGAPEDRRGLEGLCAVREISLMSIPATNLPNALDALQNRCDGMRDRFAIRNVLPPSNDYTQVRPPSDTSYGAIYYPDLLVAAPHTPEGWRYVPPSGHVAGIYARVDVERGVHKAPANEVVRGIITRDLAGGQKPLRYTLNKREHDVLNPRGVNVIRDFRMDGRDIRVWGARTMSSDSMWKYVNVRRLFIFIEQSIDRGTQWAVFEPNSELTWIAIRTAITNFLRTIWRNGALMGVTEEEAFFVKCDRTTMTQDDFDNGRLICLIGVAPVKPAEFVIFRISQKTIEAES
jgi:hypothetical protein